MMTFFMGVASGVVGSIVVLVIVIYACFEEVK